MLLSGAVGEIWIKPGHEPTQGVCSSLAVGVVVLSLQF